MQSNPSGGRLPIVPLLPKPSPLPSTPLSTYPVVPSVTQPVLVASPTHGVDFISKHEILDLFKDHNNQIVDLITTLHRTYQQQLTQQHHLHQQQISSLIDSHRIELESLRLRYEHDTRTLVDNMTAIVTQNEDNNRRLDDAIRTITQFNIRTDQEDEKYIVDPIDDINHRIGTLESDVTSVRAPLAGQGIINVICTKDITIEQADAMTLKDLSALINKVYSMEKVYRSRQQYKPTHKRQQTIDALARNIIILKDVRDRKKRQDVGVIPT